ncbi:Bifunctional protein FolD 4 [Forsythia ovata]|uniref:Bifunctional protein FolD 4 n=1 Tax=Forsythia ovata TaxID=205694 RepID=A0ABD1SJ74_9LAMI
MASILLIWGILPCKEGNHCLFLVPPKGCIELLLRYGVELIGKKAVVIGRSKIVGLPTSLLLQNPEQVTSGADIVISDVGVPNIVRGCWLKPGAIVIDTGTHYVKEANSLHGRRVVGDVCYEEAITKASAITPVPGGVGPVSISMLLSNTLDSAKRAYNIV